MPALTVQNAEITTATVEIRTLTISGKQVTLAVFRQLEQAKWIGADHNPRGQAWGRVNYCPDGRRCGVDEYRERRDHAHIVWQLGPELRRDTVYRPTYRHLYGTDEDYALRVAWWDAVLKLPQLFIAV